MPLSHSKLRQLYADFWTERTHKESPPAPLVLTEDPTTLFTSSGMQPLVPYLSGEPHAEGKRLYNIQPCIRTQDIDEVGDNRHTTFFEMMGNWSLGDYFKEEQLSWCWEFYTKIVGIAKEKIYVTVFEGNKEVPKDTESYEIWKKLGVPEDRIYFYDATKNWWSRSGPPDKMPPGEIGGPDSEMFYDFGTEHNPEYGKECHPNCDCGRFMEFGNSVFIQYKKRDDGKLEELPQKNVDFGGGLERLAAVVNNDPDVFKSDVFSKIISSLETVSGLNYAENKSQSSMRIIADHMKAAVFLAKDGVSPSNKQQGYVMRRLIRKSAYQMKKLGVNHEQLISKLCESIIETYKQEHLTSVEIGNVALVILDEVNKFMSNLAKGQAMIQNMKHIDGKVAFDMYQSYGFPLEITEEIAKDKGLQINHEEFENEFNKHKELSRSSSAGMFKGGLADHSDQVIKYHTATHLLHQALFDVVGSDVRQEGSNITAERLRFDFSAPQKPTDEQVRQVESAMNEQVHKELPVAFEMMPKEDALKVGAKSFFREKYPDTVKVYYVGDSLKNAYSKEFCGGPHVTNTKEIGSIAIYKLEKIGSNLYRIYAK